MVCLIIKKSLLYFKRERVERRREWREERGKGGSKIGESMYV